MASHPRISQLLIETGAYKDLEKPVILTSGLVGVYYINTEKLVQDGGKFAEYGNDSRQMINHACRMSSEHPSFGEVIDILAEETEKYFSEESVPQDQRAISGGQRRDWLFSGPVAKKLGYHHISLYKKGQIYTVFPDGSITDRTQFSGIAHHSDLLTTGSSACEEPNGWIPNLERHKSKVRKFFAAVSRLQGGETALLQAGVPSTSFVYIDEDFLAEYSKQPHIAKDYFIRGAKAWGDEYITREGVDDFVDFFSPEARSKDDRGENFLRQHRMALMFKRGAELRKKVSDKYNTDLKELPLPEKPT